MHKGKLEVLNDYSYLIKGEDTIFIAHNLDNTQRKIIIPEPFARKEEAFLLPALSTVVGYEIGGSFYLKLLPDWVYIDLNEEGSN